MDDDIFIFSHDHLMQQVADSPLELGYHKVRFYIDAPGIPSKQKN